MKNLLTLLLATASLALVGCGGPPPGDAVKDLAYAMEAGDHEKMKELVPALEENLGDSKIETLAKQAKKKIEEEGGLESVTIDKETISDDGKTATVTATMKNKDVKPKPKSSSWKKSTANGSSTWARI